MNIAEFVRLYPVRCPNLQWFLGAGASAAAGIPTAFDIIWDLKRAIYCSEQQVAVSNCSDLGDPTLRARIQGYFDSLSGYPAEDAEDEYAFYFERAYAAEQDRQKYIARLVSAGVPSYGHQVLAALLAAGKVRLVWTTNFDRMIEDAAIATLGSSGKLAVAELDTPQRALEAMNEGRWPLVGKLHGDFHSRRLKNTTSELRAQDQELRHALIEGCKRYGLAVVGYSGRDRSVMDALEAALDDRHPFPNGLFWFHRAGGGCLPRVVDLIEKAKAKGVDAHLVEGGTFDELFGDVLRLLPDLPAEVTKQLDRKTQRLAEAPVLTRGRSWPLLRTNALLVNAVPTVCRRLTCQIGNTSEIRRAVADAGADVVAGRTQFGVLAFGSDEEVHRAFDSFEITEFGIHAIETRRLHYESTELGLLYETLCRAIARERPILIDRRRRSHLARVDAERTDDPAFEKLFTACRGLTGIVPKTSLCWAEAVRLRIEFRRGRLWLLLEPTIWLDSSEDDETLLIAREFRRARLASRYNRQWNATLDGWVDAIIGPDANSVTLRAFGIATGIDAQYEIMRRTAFSRLYTDGWHA